VNQPVRWPSREHHYVRREGVSAARADWAALGTPPRGPALYERGVIETVTPASEASFLNSSTLASGRTIRTAA